MRIKAFRKLILFSGLLLVVVTSGPTNCLSQEIKRLTADEVIASHLESIGTAEARAAFKSVVAQGAVTATIRAGGSGQGKGGAVMASQGTRLKLTEEFSDFVAKPTCFCRTLIKSSSRWIRKTRRFYRIGF
jgi:hypothetical protein